MAAGHFVRLFLLRVARQATGTGVVMVREPGDLAPERKRSPGRNWQGFFCTKGHWAGGVRNYKTLSALGRWFGFGRDEIASSLVGSAGCKIRGLVWFLPKR